MRQHQASVSQSGPIHPDIERVAVVGSGIAGLSAAWMLSQRFQVTLFERASSPGMGAYNFDFNHGRQTTRIDVPIRAFNRSHYRNLVALYHHIGVEMCDAAHSASYTYSRTGHTYLGYRYLNVGRHALPLPVVGLNSRLVADFARFFSTARLEMRLGRLQGWTLGEYLARKNFSKQFIDDVLLPSFAAICTCSYEAVRCYPAEDIVDFLSGGLLFNRILRVKGGADRAINRLLAPVNEIENSAVVTGVVPGPEEVTLHLKDDRRLSFNHVVLATQAGVAAKLCEKADPGLARLLGEVPSQLADIMLHTDDSILPKDPAGRSPVTFRVNPERENPMATLELNQIIPQLREAPSLFETVEDDGSVDESSILVRANIERPLVTLESRKAMSRLQHLQAQGKRRIWVTGSYAMPGIPLQESAVSASLKVAGLLGVPLPW